jgi:hypothetical protein
MMNDDNRPLIGGIVLASAAVLGLLAVLCWTEVLPVDQDARGMMTLAFGIAAAADAAVGVFFLTRSRPS